MESCVKWWGSFPINKCNQSPRPNVNLMNDKSRNSQIGFTMFQYGRDTVFMAAARLGTSDLCRADAC